MNYEKEYNEYIADVDRLWLEMQTIHTVGLTPEQVQAIRAFQQENDKAHSKLHETKADTLLAYKTANPQTKAQMEASLKKLRDGLAHAETVYRKAQESRS